MNWASSAVTENDVDILEEAEDTLTAEYYHPIAARKAEVCIVEVPSIVIVIETGFGYYTYPMLVIETKMSAEIRDWSSSVSSQCFLPTIFIHKVLIHSIFL